MRRMVYSFVAVRAGPRFEAHRNSARFATRTVYGSAGAAVNTDARPKKFTVLDLAARKRAVGPPITMITAYDAWSAQACELAGADVVLVGDSAGNVVQGNATTTCVTMDEMVLYTRAVSRQCQSALVVADLPFGSYVDAGDGVRNAVRLVKEGGCDCVKLEGGSNVADIVRAITRVGIPVFAHVGVTPQTSSSQGGFRVQGKTLESAVELLEAARDLQQAGACAIVLEMVSAGTSMLISSSLQVPAIGIGSGSSCDGQVLVFHDMLGLLRGGHQPRFSKRYADLLTAAAAALSDFRREVASKEFPTRKHSFLSPSAHVEAVRQEALKRGFTFHSTPSPVPPPSSVAIVGGGALGSLVAALLARTGCSVTLVSSWREHVDAIDAAKGVRLRERGTELLCPVEAMSPARAVAELASRPPQLVIILVKSWQTEQAAALAAQLCDASTTVLSLQNGIGHLALIRKSCGLERVMVGTTSLAARVAAPGLVLSTSVGGSTMLSPAGFDDDDAASSVFAAPCVKAAAVSALFAAADLDVRVAGSADLMRANVYGKLLVNSVINPLTSVHGCLNGELLAPRFQPEVAGLTAESSAVLHASKGLQLANALELVQHTLHVTADNESSMLADVRRGMPTEIDVISGTVVQLAKRLGSDAPLNKAMVRKVRALVARRAYSTAAVATSVAEMRAWRAAQGTCKVGFVPTMGGLHQDHLELGDAARQAGCQRVVYSIYVNPTQFAAHEDLDRYPRTLQADLALLNQRGVDAVFTPSTLYHPLHKTWVEPLPLTVGEAAARPTHFRGVATVVTKLLNIVLPDALYMGQKDAQQCIVVRNMLRDLDSPVQMVVVPTSRERDGLARSTRNQYLNPEQRRVAPVLYRALQHAAQQWPCSPAALRSSFEAHVAAEAREAVRVQYVSVSCNETGRELGDHDAHQGPVLLSAAIGFPGASLRLLDCIVFG